MPSRIRLFPILILFAFAALGAPAQVFDMQSGHAQMMELRGPMRFHPGDDRAWAAPGFDDSKWPLIQDDKSWAGQGYAGLSGVAWYRFRVRVPAGHAQLALGVPQILTSCEVFADGVRIGGEGRMPPHAVPYFTVPQVFLLPALPRGQPATVTIAIRVWHTPLAASFIGGGILAPLRLGDAYLLEDWLRLQREDATWRDSAGILEIELYFLAGLGCIFLFALRRSEQEYLWFGLSNLFAALALGVQVVIDHHQVRVDVSNGLENLVGYVSLLCFLEFVLHLMKARRNRLYWAAIAVLLLSMAIIVPNELGWWSVGTANLIQSLLPVPFFACVLLMLWQAARAGDTDARLVLAPVALSYGSGIALVLSFALWGFGVSAAAPVYDWLNRMTSRPFPIGLEDATGVLQLLALLAILVLRFARSRRDEERLRGELEAARTVQAVLVPDVAETVPGFRIQSVYRPASEVGGDFFQIIPCAGGGILAVIGDVSGKGMPAAMTVSLLVGALRTLAGYIERPGEILKAMNQRMMGRTKGGFTTCLIVRIDAAGAVAAANAGHPAPYLGGCELALEFGLPLGISAEAAYPETRCRLGDGQQLTLVTDGVMEARAGNGELFGFERAAQMSTLGAEQIAEAAQQFGQQDDITVLTIERIAAVAADIDSPADPATALA